MIGTAVKKCTTEMEEDKTEIEGEDVALGSEVKDMVKVVLDTLEERGQDIRALTKVVV